MVQDKLTVNQPGDKYEQEADRVASQVVQQINTSKIQPYQSEETIQPQTLMRKAETQENNIRTSPQFEASLKQERGTGQPLHQSIREPMEQAFGTDLSGVRVHTTSLSNELNETVQAKAFTTGRDVFFREGAYQPGSREGQELIAHELTHVVQQNGTTALGNTAVIQREETKLLSKEAGKKTKDEEKYLKQSKSGYQNVTEKTSELAGAEIAAKKIIEAKDQDFKAACELLMRAGFFGSYSTKTETGTFSRNSSQELFTGVDAKGKVSAEVKDVIEGIKLLAEISTQGGIGATLAEDLAFNAGELSLKLKGKLESFIGFKASAKSELKLNVLDGLVASASAEAKAGISLSGNVSAELSKGNLGAQVAAEGKYDGGASAKATSKAQVGPAGISGSVSAEALAGAQISGKVSGSITTRKGNKLINISTGGSLSAGVGAKVKGEATFSKGTFKLGTAVGGTLGVGGGAEIEIEIDISAIKGAIKDACSSPNPSTLMSKVAEKRPNMPEAEVGAMKAELYNALFPKVYNYAKGKAKSGSAKHYVKRQVVQEIIAKEVQGSDRLAEIIWYKESDEVLAEMAYDATTKAANEAEKPKLIAASESSFGIRRGVILLWPYKSE
ncbi:DUF4157 domain-containing protein [Tolypothrix sp. LEGE 11397]|nr:DUF4157 domain-containing protein [Tolypothrix sp. LEGE 11397]UYD30071.1 DUF4157 domain-containing protein [Tolypothrix sp. PCC 7712]UYD38002.1 DUF4157 domain-containing protein [Tolypothrix sp. PCC 7601]